MASSSHSKYSPVRALFFVGGILCLVSAGIGVAVPGWPTTVFCILALYCFKRSSSKLENWLLQHRVVGPVLRDWDENKWISKRVKLISIGTMWVFVLLATACVKRMAVLAIIVGLAALGTWYIASRRTKPEAVPATECEAKVA